MDVVFQISALANVCAKMISMVVAELATARHRAYFAPPIRPAATVAVLALVATSAPMTGGALMRHGGSKAAPRRVCQENAYIAHVLQYNT